MSAEWTQSGAEILLRALKDQGVDTIFGYPGGAVLPIYDALFNQNAIRHILVRQEGGAVHAAEGYARATGKVGVVLVTSGPGATNAVTGLVDALMDSIPIVCLTGQVPTQFLGKGRGHLHEMPDQLATMRTFVKWAERIEYPDNAPTMVSRAFQEMLSGRRGPQKAICAVAASILTAVYHMLKDGTQHVDLGADYFDRRPTEAKARRLVAQLNKLGYEVQIQPIAAAA